MNGPFSTLRKIWEFCGTHAEGSLANIEQNEQQIASTRAGNHQ
jgi:hypothetical protein